MTLRDWRLTDDDYYGLACGVAGIAVAFALALTGCGKTATAPVVAETATTAADADAVAMPDAVSESADATLTGD